MKTSTQRSDKMHTKPTRPPKRTRQHSNATTHPSNWPAREFRPAQRPQNQNDPRPRLITASPPTPSSQTPETRTDLLTLAHTHICDGRGQAGAHYRHAPAREFLEYVRNGNNPRLFSPILATGEQMVMTARENAGSLSQRHRHLPPTDWNAAARTLEGKKNVHLPRPTSQGIIPALCWLEGSNLYGDKCSVSGTPGPIAPP